MKKILTVVVTIFFVFSNSFALLTAQVTGGTIEKPLVTIVSDNIVDAFALNTKSIITKDLDNSGSMDANEKIKYEVKSVKDIPWKDVNSDYVVLVNYTKKSNSSYDIDVSVVKRYNSGDVKIAKYTGINVSQERQLAHKVANFATKVITGENGFYLTKLAYIKVTNPYARYGRVYELIISDYDGYNKQVALKQTNNPVATPSWSSDGKKIIYSSYTGGGMGIYSLELATGKISEIVKYKGINSAPAYSPNNQSVVMALSKGYSDQTNIYVMNLATKAMKSMTINGINTSPKFSPDGKNIVFTSDRGGRPNLYMAPVDAKYPTSSVLTTKVYQAYDPSYTPDGKSVVFMYQKARGQGTQIATLDLSNNKIDVLTNGKSDASPTVAPYGDVVAYISANQRGYTSLEMSSLDGDKHMVIDEMQNGKTILQSPSWSPINF